MESEEGKCDSFCKGEGHEQGTPYVPGAGCKEAQNSPSGTCQHDGTPLAERLKTRGVGKG